MVDQFENGAIPFNNELAQQIKSNIHVQLGKIQGSTEQMPGYDRANYLLNAQQLTGNEMKQLRWYIDQFPRDKQGKISDPAYYLIGGDALNTFIQIETERLRHQINKADENEDELGKAEKQDFRPTTPPNTEAITGLPSAKLNEEIRRIKNLIQH